MITLSLIIDAPVQRYPERHHPRLPVEGLPGGMDGYELANAVRADSALANTPLIAVSGYNSDQHKARAQDAGFDRIFRKPLKFNDVSEALASFSHGKPADRRVLTRPGTYSIARRHYDNY
jgi:CheY-like chemotaxis protein